MCLDCTKLNFNQFVLVNLENKFYTYPVLLMMSNGSGCCCLLLVMINVYYSKETVVIILFNIVVKLYAIRGVAIVNMYSFSKVELRV